jgi:hypothetical protein
VFEALREGLIQSYKPKAMPEVRCAICGAERTPLSLHVLEYYSDSRIPTPPSFVSMSQSGGTSRGSIPICTSCAAPCGKCGIPITTPWHRKLGALFQSDNPGVTVRTGQGYCRHAHPLSDLVSIFKPLRIAGLNKHQSKQPLSEERVKDSIAAIEKSDLIPGFHLVKDAVRDQLKDRDRTRASIEEDGLSPDGLVYLLISNVTNAQLCSGQHHIYRGVLSITGKELLAAFTKASEMMVQCGVHSREDHERDMRNLKKEIAEVG